ncbi:cation:proton antiporter [Aquisalimonas lutea]|uniref:cation:proton antiporter n=1 Tax=Aquisalimonas lutea TaxID=1327750 RepID=UPI0025B52E47|nr:cation:proton antiporter [Aquisalimonas lutea]MDN3517611.1 cation:proton antiporter [Aquisalimonas lutea]
MIGSLPVLVCNRDRVGVDDRMGDAAISLILLGAILSASILVDVAARRTSMPRISLLILIGVAVAAVQQLVLGSPGVRPLGELGEPLIQLALVMVAFLLGGELTAERLRTLGPVIFRVSAAVVVASVAVVGLGIALMGYPLAVAVCLAAVSVATDPAAVLQAVRDSGDDSLRARVLKGVVAIDDAWGILVFGLAMALLGWHTSVDGAAALGHAAWELGGALLLGGLIGLPAAWLTGRLQPGKPTQVEALALILLMTGLAEVLEISGLLMAMVAGCVIANASVHHTRAFNEIENIEWPFLVFFFVLSGASVDFTAVGPALGLVAAYIVLRLAGRYLGGLAAVRLDAGGGRLPPAIGLALTPQAGVAMGMALLAAERFPEHAGLLMTTAVTSTIIFEVAGPFLVARVLRGRAAFA